MSDLETTGGQLTEMEIDVIGEVMNISMGSAATAMSTILDKKVSITTPRTELMPIEEFEFSYLEPVIGVLIKYIEGIDGSNVLLLREDDLKKILKHLLSMEPEEDLEFDEISISAVCEIMNQMMGSAASALASFLGTMVNISPPQILDVANATSVREIFAITSDIVVSIKFNLIVDDIVQSEFICAMEPTLVREMVKMSLGATEVEETPPPAPAPIPVQQEAPEVAAPQPVQQMQAEAPQMQYQQQAPAQPAPQMMQQPAPQMQQMQQMPDQGYYQREEPPREPVQVSPYNYKPLRTVDALEAAGIDPNNLDLIMAVPIQISVELGRTKKKIKDIAELTLGNIVELDRQAGDHVDILANGKLIARGDVVVVDDNYSVRITEIVKRDGGNDANKL
ncbi:MAG: flagellar motor switch phosphatase FliY [Eubacteriales bacterium]|nr:flagellar motor switch phosphatase FliY [Eubacteriales bacterium]